MAAALYAASSAAAASAATAAAYRHVSSGARDIFIMTRMYCDGSIYAEECTFVLQVERDRNSIILRISLLHCQNFLLFVDDLRVYTCSSFFSNKKSLLVVMAE